MDKAVVGKRVRRQRERLSLTRDQFAEAVSISPQFLAEVENGKKGMSAETLYKICERTGASADYILTGRQSTEIKGTPAADMLNKIPPKYSTQVEDMLSALLEAIEIAKREDNIELSL